MSEHGARARALKILFAGVLTSCAPTVITAPPASDGSIADAPGPLDAPAVDAGTIDAAPLDRPIIDATEIDAGKVLPDAGDEDGGCLLYTSDAADE